MPLRCDGEIISVSINILCQVFTKHSGEAAMAVCRIGIKFNYHPAKRARRQSSPPRAMQSWLNEVSLNLVGSGAIAAARSIPSTAGW